MKTRSLLVLTLATAALVAITRGADAPEVKVTPATAPAPKAEPAAKGKLVLEKGLEAEFILKGYGQPYEIKAIEAPDKNLKAERWTYRRKVKETSIQTASSQSTIPVYSGAGPGGTQAFTNVVVPEYRLKHITIYQVTELLIINGKLEVAKQWMGQEESYN